jgi:hypothetical protein
MKAIFEKPTANITLNSEKLKASPLRSGGKKHYNSYETKKSQQLPN